MLAGRALMIGINIRALLLDMRFASGVTQKWAAADRIGDAYCVPAVGDAAPIGLDSLHVMCRQAFHKDAPVTFKGLQRVRLPLQLRIVL